MTSGQRAESFWSRPPSPTTQLVQVSLLAAVPMTLGVAGAMARRNWIIIAAFGVMTTSSVVAVSALALWDLWLFWIPKPDRPVGQTLGRFVAAVVLLTAVFGVVTALSLPPYSSDANANLREIFRADSHYLWHFLDAVPVLKIPQTLNWADPLPLTTYAAGAALLLYQLLIVLPVVSTTTALIKRTPTQHAEAAPPRSADGYVEARARADFLTWAKGAADRNSVVLGNVIRVGGALAAGSEDAIRTELQPLITAIDDLAGYLDGPKAPHPLSPYVQRYREVLHHLRVAAEVYVISPVALADARDQFAALLQELNDAGRDFLHYASS